MHKEISKSVILLSTGIFFSESMVHNQNATKGYLISLHLNFHDTLSKQIKMCVKNQNVKYYSKK